MFTDWKNEYAIISNKLSIDKAKHLVDYYRRIENLTSIQQEIRRIKLLVESNPEIIDSFGHGLPQMFIGFKEQTVKLLNTLPDYELIDKLKKIR